MRSICLDSTLVQANTILKPLTAPGWAPAYRMALFALRSIAHILPCCRQILHSHILGSNPASYPGSAHPRWSHLYLHSRPFTPTPTPPHTAGSICTMLPSGLNKCLFLSLEHCPYPRPPQLSLSSEDATQVFLFQGVLPDYHGPGHPSCVFITVPSAEFITVQSWVCLFHQGMEYMRVFKVKVLAIQSCLTLCEPTDCSLPGSSIHGILQAIILEWAAIPSSRGSS